MNEIRYLALRCDRHPDAEASASCVFCGRPGCERCVGVALPNEWVCPEHESLRGTMTLVFEHDDPFLIDAVRKNLELNGIALMSFDHSEYIDDRPFTTTAPGRIWVANADADRTRQVVEDLGLNGLRS